MSATIVGRTAELAILQRVLGGISDEPAAIVIEGDVGAGKTTVWDAAVSAARELRYRVLVSRPDESEQSLPYVALTDLLDGIVDDPNISLPGPQHRALRVAVLLDEPENGPPDQRAVAVATLNLLRSLSQRSPVVVAIDDLHWMDSPSARVLEYVVRRLEDERIGVMVAVRATATAPSPTLLDRTLSGRELHRVALAPLDADALGDLLAARLATPLPRLMMAQVALASAGNPLFALELARGIQRGEIEPRTGEPLSVPRNLQQFVQERMALLPADTRELLFLASAAPDPTIDLLEMAAHRSDAVPAALEAAVSAGVLEISGNHLRFMHPLFASTLYHAVSPGRRRRLHRELAALVSGPDERARHLSLGADGPDRIAAAAVDDSARRASARGAPDAAADLAERAYELTPSGDTGDRHQRQIDAAEYHFASGNVRRARQIFEEAAGVLPPGPVRASVLRRLAKVRYRSDSCSVAAQLLTRALAEAADDSTLSASIERDLAWAVMLCGDLEAASTHASSALELISRMGNVPMVAEVLAATAMADFLRGMGLPADVMRRAISLEGVAAETPIEWRPSMMLAMMLNWSGATSQARHRFDDLHRQTLEAGEETSLPFLLAQMSESATSEGDFESALSRAEDAIAVSLQTGQEPMRAAALHAMALAQAHRGDVDHARATALAGLRLAEKVGSVVMMMWNQAVLGFVELSVDDPAAAHEHLAPLLAWLDIVGIGEPGMLHFIPDEVEALVALGQLEKANDLLASYEADAGRLQRPSAQLAASRCRALHMAASGNPAEAVKTLREALEGLSSDVPSFERARALLVLGSVQRRTRRRRDARDSLESALAIFDQLDARTWSMKARRTLGGGKTPARDGQSNLTPAELRVAQLVAGGATNREAADLLFVSTRTVELHLTSVYQKLGIRSRTQLAVRMAADRSPSGAP